MKTCRVLIENISGSPVQNLSNQIAVWFFKKEELITAKEYKYARCAVWSICLSYLKYPCVK